MRKFVSCFDCLSVALIVLFILRPLVGLPLEATGLSRTSPVYSHFTYVFFHDGLLHTAMNVSGYIYAARLIKATRTTGLYTCVAWSYAACTLTTWLSMADVATVGASSLVGAMLGYLTGSVSALAIFKRARINREVFVPLCVMLSLWLVAGFAVPCVNARSHLFATVAGGIAGFVVFVFHCLRMGYAQEEYGHG